MAKISTMGTKKDPAAASLVLGAKDINAHKVFNGKTLAQLGEEFELEDSDVSIAFNMNPKNNEEIPSLAIRIKGQKYLVPFSKGYPMEEATASADSLLNGVFRVNFMTVKDANGEATDSFTTTPYLSFGKPGGLTIAREERAFAAATTASAVTA